MTDPNSKPTPSQPSPEEERKDAVWGRRCDLLYRGKVQLRYHKRRQMFFDRIDKLSKSLTLMLSATLVGADIKDSLPYLASAISFLTLLALVFSYSERKQTHKELAEAYGALLSKIEEIPPLIICERPETVAAWASELVKVGTKAPPPLKRLTLYCEREENIASGEKIQKQQKSCRNGWWLFMYYF